MPGPYQFTQTSARFGLPFLFAAQAQREFFVNEAFARTDLLLHASVEGEQSAPPESPVNGQAWIIKGPAIGEWESRENQIAGWQAGTWQFIEPTDGMRVWDKSSGCFAIYASGWSWPVRPAIPTGGVTADQDLRDAFSGLLEALAKAGIFPVT